MSERKVLNKYYPPDFDPSKIPRMKLARNRQYTVRLMAPFNMRCATCGEYIYKGKKFNARKEDVEHEDYLGIRIYRFYIKCTRCLQEISFKTDPKNTDYVIEAGATRNFMALKLAEEQARREEEELREEEANNPMKLLENRTEQSRNEIEILESLEDLKDLNRRHATVDYEAMLKQCAGETPEERRKREEAEDEEFVKSIKFERGSTRKIVLSEEIIEEDDDDDDESEPTPSKRSKHEIESPSTIAPNKDEPKKINSILVKPSQKNQTWNKSIGLLSKKSSLAGVKINKKPTTATNGDVLKTDTPSTTSEKAPATNSESSAPKPTSGLSLFAGYSDTDSE